MRALGLRGIGTTNTLPDRPEIRGMIARVPHLIKVTAGNDGSVSTAGGEVPHRRRGWSREREERHDLKPAPGSTKARRRVGRGIAGKGGKTAGRGTKGQGARNNIKPGFEGGQLPLKQRIPKLKGFKNPFRVEYNVINLDTLEDSTGHVVSPGDVARRRPGAQARPGQGARAGAS